MALIDYYCDYTYTLTYLLARIIIIIIIIIFFIMSPPKEID